MQLRSSEDKFDPSILNPETCTIDIAEKWSDKLLDDIDWIIKAELIMLYKAVCNEGDKQYRAYGKKPIPFPRLLNLIVGIKKRSDNDSIEKELLNEAIKLLASQYSYLESE